MQRWRKGLSATRHWRRRAGHRLAGVAALVLTCAGCGGGRLDANLCPRDASPARATVLLLDTSDPLTPKHGAELRRLVDELQDQAGEFPVAPGERLVVYAIAEDLAAIEPLLQVCNPGVHPDNWGWWEEISRGRAIDLHHWGRFKERVEALFAHVGDQLAQPSSPIIETLGVIVPRYASSLRHAASSKAEPTHLILFSDLLQHSPALSHYGEYPDGDANTVPLSALRTNLANVDVSIYRLSRERDSRWQTPEHYHWWKHFVRASGGRVVWMEPL